MRLGQQRAPVPEGQPQPVERGDRAERKPAWHVRGRRKPDLRPSPGTERKIVYNAEVRDQRGIAEQGPNGAHGHSEDGPFNGDWERHRRERARSEVDLGSGGLFRAAGLPCHLADQIGRLRACDRLSIAIAAENIESTIVLRRPSRSAR